jgi:hypothetical protein
MKEKRIYNKNMSLPPGEIDEHFSPHPSFWKWLLHCKMAEFRSNFHQESRERENWHLKLEMSSFQVINGIDF